jgi:DNA-binding transcriptional LysR family regulator
MDHITLDIFRTVAAELSITRAAKRLGRVQSNVTTRIQQLEEELDVALFRRDGNRLSLSAEGERFLDYANRLLALAEEARQVLHPQAPAGVLRVGTMESTAASRLPEPLARYHRQWPQVQLKISTAPSRPMLEQVRSGLLDCALVALPPCGDMASASDLEAMGLRGEPVFREELVLLLPPGHPPVQRPADIIVHSLAAFAQGCSYRALVEDWLGAEASSFDAQEVGSYHTMLACVASGTCMCLLPRSVLELLRELPDIQVHSVAEVDTWLVWRHGYDTAAFTALREVLAQPTIEGTSA